MDDCQYHWRVNLEAVTVLNALDGVSGYKISLTTKSNTGAINRTAFYVHSKSFFPSDEQNNIATQVFQRNSLSSDVSDYSGSYNVSLPIWELAGAPSATTVQIVWVKVSPIIKKETVTDPGFFARLFGARRRVEYRYELNEREPIYSGPWLDPNTFYADLENEDRDHFNIITDYQNRGTAHIYMRARDVLSDGEEEVTPGPRTVEAYEARLKAKLRQEEYDKRKRKEAEERQKQIDEMNEHYRERARKRAKAMEEAEKRAREEADEEWRKKREEEAERARKRKEEAKKRIEEIKRRLGVDEQEDDEFLPPDFVNPT